MPYNTRAAPAYAFIGTLFNVDWQFPAELPPGIDYMCGQVERCPTTDRLHWQLFIKSGKKVRFSQIKKILGQQNLDLTPVTMTEFKARKYAMKDETRVSGPFEIGDYKRSKSDVLEGQVKGTGQDKSQNHPFDYAYISMKASPKPPERLTKHMIVNYCFDHCFDQFRSLCKWSEPYVWPEDVFDD